MNFSRTQSRYVGIALAILCLVLSLLVKPEGLSPQAVRTLGVLAATLCLQLSESFHLCVCCLISGALLFSMGCVDSISAAFSGYTNHVLYFILGSFGISAAFQKSVVSRKLLGLLMRAKQLTAKRISFTFMVCAAVLSSVMSNVAAVVIFIPYLQKYLEFFEDDARRRKTARSTYICLAVSALIGGMITPAGSSVNLIGLDLMEQYAGIHVRFIDWMCFGLPLAIVMLVVAFLIINLVYPPEAPQKHELDAFLDYVRNSPPAEFRDIFVSVIIVVTLLVWILSSWVPAINITTVAIFSFGLMFLPGMNVLNWEEFSKVNSWSAFFVTGNHITLAGAAISTGLCDYFAGLIFGGSSGLSILPMLLLVAAVTFLFMAVIPSAPAVATILVPILITFATRSGVDPKLLFMTSILCIPNIYLFPLDAPLVVCYDKKAFTMFELPRATVWIQLAMIVIVSIWVVVAYGFVF